MGCGAAVTPCNEADGGRCEMNADCPTAVPTRGATCSIPATANCTYQRQAACGNTPGVTASCSATTHTWDVQQSSCNPPRPVCPQTAPADGQACTNFGSPPLNCDYNPCGTSFSVHAQCSVVGGEGHWQVQQSSCNPPAPMCPPAEPAAGDACMPSQTLLHCRYGNCGDGSPTSESSCDSGSLTWRSMALVCGDPVDAGGDGDAASDGGVVNPTDGGGVVPGDGSVEPADGGTGGGSVDGG